MEFALSFLLPQACAFVATILYGSFFEWTLHRFVMHKKTIISYPFELHAIIHHQLFKADETYHAQSEEMLTHVTFVPRDYLILLCVNAPLIVAVELLTGWPIAIGGALAILAYLGMFDILHWCFHVPKGRWFEKFAPFRWIKRHHLLHHKYQHRNFNVVFPLADLCLGTLVRRPNPGATILEV